MGIVVIGARELSLTPTNYSTQESRPCTLPEQHNRANSVTQVWEPGKEDLSIAALMATLLIILSVEFIVGILGNAFMALVNIRGWVKIGKISVVDQILTALAISRIAFLLLIISIILISALSPALLRTEKIIRITNASWILTNHFSNWLATCLSVFYFLKISNFSSSLFFFYLKWRVETVVSVTLMVSLLIVFVNIIIINTYIDVWVDRYKLNTSHSSITSNSQLYKLILLTNTMFTLIPFTVSLITFFLIIFSLWRHLKKIQNNAKGFQNINITAHIKTLQMVVAFLLLYTVFFLALAFQSWNNKPHHKNTAHMFSVDTGLVFPSGHSYVLILGNSKLRQRFLSLMCWTDLGGIDEQKIETAFGQQAIPGPLLVLGEYQA
ncbi:LOW QUALITY PROTEIN: taste receptor type 2 member 140-like [Arvicola amphibius]|uniref:LOW QUALITY PROTEIN: taste receptor type 2 member 140-like n=1 Tax=Arvicola amphibius TaxID=1047088 RepID=UPI001C092426|nr:LOW QUALITY PROTEIN: taste receptor type 2 member 140-like [Arvicola amphibius]